MMTTAPLGELVSTKRSLHTDSDHYRLARKDDGSIVPGSGWYAVSGNFKNVLRCRLLKE